MQLSDSRQLQQICLDLNTVAAFLALDDFGGQRLSAEALRSVLGVPSADLLVLLGNSVLHTAERAFDAVRNGAANRILIAGGRGHSTDLLYATVREHPLYHAVEGADRTEADMLAEIAVRYFEIDPNRIVLEQASSNCGENAAFTLRTIEAEHLPARTIILVQDPTMQRRSDATFRKVWRDAGCPLSLANYPAFTPALRISNDALVYDQPNLSGLWSVERFISLVLGEIPRLSDDPSGYGPKGRGFIEHVEIPPQVSNAHNRLTRLFPDGIRPAVQRVDPVALAQRDE